ncbi:MAG TPA: PQQ-dependent sugar dehydrogenase, partial [Hyphomicrobiaceae bacterium]|nr:PQQ-dependent sugar dehydrogenase [Hyphomicrobiaceae bacterium]
MRTLVAAATIACLASSSNLIEPACAEQTRAPAPTPSRITVTTFAKGLAHPWSIAFLPDQRLIVTERDGRMRIIARDGRVGDPFKGVPTVAATGQGGLLDVVLAPDFATTGTIFFSFSEPRDGGLNGTSVARASLVVDEGGRGELRDLKVVFRQQPATRGGLHFGSRLAFAPDGTLFVTLGERYQRDEAQSLEKHWGKVVRINPDGSVPADNPFVGRTGVLPELWSLGHRNPQSAAMHPGTHELWTVEHGARGGDEVNIPRKGRNYGWPLITYGRDYSGARIGAGTARDGLEQPIYYWDPSIAPSGMAFYTSDAAPHWRGNLFVGALAGQLLVRLVLDGEKVVGEERLLTDLGKRIRDVRAGPDGAVWVATDEPRAEIIRVMPL